MMSVLLGQARHLLTAAGAAMGGAGAAAGDSPEAVIGGLVLALLGHLLSWLNARGAAAPPATR